MALVTHLSFATGTFLDMTFDYSNLTIKLAGKDRVSFPKGLLLVQLDVSAVFVVFLL